MVDIRYDVETRLCVCWACGRDERNPPSTWFAPFCIENAHIIGGPTRSSCQDTREAIVLLCTRCHRLAHGDRIPDARAGGMLPNLQLENLIWLKMHRDAEYYSGVLLCTWFGKLLPQPCPPDGWFLRQWQERCGVPWKGGEE